VVHLHENIDDKRGIAEIGEMIEPWVIPQRKISKAS
jgi:hypothetical protein